MVSPELSPVPSVAVASAANSPTGSLSMSWNGQPVRSLFDPERQLWVCNSLGTKGLNLEAIYENGELTGLPCAKQYFAEILGCRPEECLIGGNASLTLMYDTIAKAYTHMQ